MSGQKCQVGAYSLTDKHASAKINVSKKPQKGGGMHESDMDDDRRKSTDACLADRFGDFGPGGNRDFCRAFSKPVPAGFRQASGDDPRGVSL